MTGETSHNTTVSTDSLNSNTTVTDQGRDYPPDTAIIVVIAAACALLVAIVAIILWWIFCRRKHSCGECACMEKCASDVTEDKKSLSNFKKDKEMFEIQSSINSHRDTIIEEQEQSFDFDTETKSLGMNTMARREHVYDQRMQLMQELFQSLDEDQGINGSIKLLPKLQNKENGEVIHKQESTGLSLLMNLNTVQPSSPSLSKINETNVNVIQNLKVTSSLLTQAYDGFNLTQSIISETPPSKQTEARKDLSGGRSHDTTFVKPAESSVSLPNNVMTVTASHKSAESGGINVFQTVVSDASVPIQAQISKSLHEKTKSDLTVTKDDIGNKLSKKDDIGNKLQEKADIGNKFPEKADIGNKSPEPIIPDKASHHPVETTMSWSRNVTPDPTLLHEAGTENNSLDRAHAASITHKPVETSTSWSRNILSDEPSLEPAGTSYNLIELTKPDPFLPKLAQPSIKDLEFDTISTELSKTDNSEVFMTKSAEINEDLSKSTILSSSSAKSSATAAHSLHSVTPDSPRKIGEKLPDSTEHDTPLTTPVNTDARSTALVNTDARSTIPANTDARLTALVNTDTRSTTPVNTDARSTTPVNIDARSTIPANTDARSTIPANTDARSTTPDNTDARSTTPANTDARSTIPANTDTRSTIPVNTDASHSPDSGDFIEKIHDKEDRNSALLTRATDVLDKFDEFLQSSGDRNEVSSVEDEVTYF